MHWLHNSDEHDLLVQENGLVNPSFLIPLACPHQPTFIDFPQPQAFERA
jgi:hypothetical protein